MQTKTYAQLYSLIQALCGVLFSPIEAPRIKAFINRRAKRAYYASDYWRRFLVVGENRQVVGGKVPFTEGALGEIDTFLRIHRREPYVSQVEQEFDFYVGEDGATLVSGTLNPESVWVTYKKRLLDTYGDATGESDSVPAEWFEYMAHGAYADYLRAEGQQEKSALADQEANEILVDELLRSDNSMTQNLVGTRILTNANMQTR